MVRFVSYLSMGMFDRFNDEARKLMTLARKEALWQGHDFVGTEHILIGMLQTSSAITTILKHHVDVEKIRAAVEKLVPRGPGASILLTLPFTPRAKIALELSLEQAKVLGHKTVGAEHLLLGVIQQADATASKALAGLGMKLEDVRKDVLEFLRGQVTREGTPG